MPFIIQSLLYTGQSLWSETISNRRDASRLADELSRRTMVEDAFVINTRTAEVELTYSSPASMWRQT